MMSPGPTTADVIAAWRRAIDALPTAKDVVDSLRESFAAASRGMERFAAALAQARRVEPPDWIPCGDGWRNTSTGAFTRGMPLVPGGGPSRAATEATRSRSPESR